MNNLRRKEVSDILSDLEDLKADLFEHVEEAKGYRETLSEEYEEALLDDADEVLYNLENACSSIDEAIESLSYLLSR